MTKTEYEEVTAGIRDTMEKVFDAFIDANRGPDDDVVHAYAALYGCSANEYRKLFAKYARSRGSNLFFAHYPANAA